MFKMNDLVEAYFHLGFHQSEILNCLAINQNIHISRRTLQRKLLNMKLLRKRDYTDPAEVAHFIQQNITAHGQLHGYRWMHLKCIQHELVVTQEIVRVLLHLLDPTGVEFRSRKRLRRRQYQNKGPNFLWHMDCYDKLKPFGICISGCIDGFSRKIIWLRAGSNSNNPRVIGGYFLDAIQNLEVCPQSIRADLGTENRIVKDFQTVLIESYGNQHQALPPFLLGTSQHNQRIEAWWSILRKHHSQYWINMFHSLRDDRLFSGSLLDKSLIQFCFLRIIQDELHYVVKEWDTHRITSSRNSISPSGRPFIMFHMPQVLRSRNYLCPIPNNSISTLRDICIFSKIPCDEDVYQLSVIVMCENNISLPSKAEEALELYVFLRTELMNLI